jgi:hypothetical protein
MEARKITLDELQQQQFATHDVLHTFQERFERDQKLRSAMALTNGQHEPVYLLIQLADGEVVEVYSDLIDFEYDYVELHGGFGIPLTAIHDVGV